jgi:hypothetical protein
MVATSSRDIFNFFCQSVKANSRTYLRWMLVLGF